MAGDTAVHLSVSGQNSSPLILVLVSYEPVRWRLTVTGGAVIDRIIMVYIIRTMMSKTHLHLCIERLL